MTKPGRHADGGNLYLYVDKDGRKKWTFFYQIGGRQREMGLGSARDVGLAKAREKAAKARELLADDIDPLETKRAANRARVAQKTFGQVADDYIEAHSPKWSNAVHKKQWRQTVNDHLKRLRDIPVGQIGTDDVLSALRPLWKKTPETASRVRARLESVLDSATARGLRPGDNPARWKGHLETLLPARRRIDRTHHAALPYQDVPAFLSQLREQQSVGAAALEFTILTAVRTGETLGAIWSEIDLDAGLWELCWKLGDGVKKAA
jgi:integrase